MHLDFMKSIIIFLLLFISAREPQYYSIEKHEIFTEQQILEILKTPNELVPIEIDTILTSQTIDLINKYLNENCIKADQARWESIFTFTDPTLDGSNPVSLFYMSLQSTIVDFKIRNRNIDELEKNQITVANVNLDEIDGNLDTPSFISATQSSLKYAMRELMKKYMADENDKERIKVINNSLAEALKSKVFVRKSLLCLNVHTTYEGKVQSTVSTEKFQTLVMPIYLVRALIINPIIYRKSMSELDPKFGIFEDDSHKFFDFNKDAVIGYGNWKLMGYQAQETHFPALDESAVNFKGFIAEHVDRHIYKHGCSQSITATEGFTDWYVVYPDPYRFKNDDLTKREFTHHELITLKCASFFPIGTVVVAKRYSEDSKGQINSDIVAFSCTNSVWTAPHVIAKSVESEVIRRLEAWKEYAKNDRGFLVMYSDIVDLIFTNTIRNPDSEENDAKFISPHKHNHNLKYAWSEDEIDKFYYFK